MKKMLNGEWSFRELANGEWMRATVPGCNYLDLLEHGKIPDPFYRTNEKDVLWIGERDWEYRRAFEVTENERKSDRIYLCADMLDTVCQVFINEELIASPCNCFIGYRFEVKRYLKAGGNEIRIVFQSPVHYIGEKQKAVECLHNGNGLDGFPHIRKPGYHFGWDWGPILPPSGISDDIYLTFSNVAEVTDVTIRQRHDNGKVNVLVSAKYDVYEGGKAELEAALIDPDGVLIETKRGDDCVFTVESPRLWWTYDMTPSAAPDLYRVLVTLKSGGQIVDQAEKTIGLRTITLNRSKDQYGSNFQFVLNGVPLFIKGASYIPPDSFITRFTDDKLNVMLDAVQFSNMNMLRVWGGGFYGGEKLYDACDRRGILVWQDFMFACQPYPLFDPELLANIKEEVQYNVRRLRSHASLALWCGNNEIEALLGDWGQQKEFAEWTEKFFYHILEPQIRRYDDQTDYIPTSPCGAAYHQEVDSDDVGDTHLWAVWHGLQPIDYYRSRMTRFCSEFGFESLPDMKTIQAFSNASDYALDSDVFTAHQKCTSGNDKMIYYIASRFHLPAKFEDYVYLSQVMQQECVSDATEHWRRNRGRCNGAIYWQLNDCWPVCSWAGMDYYGNYKALQYRSRHFNAPVSVSIEDGKETIRIVAINDTIKNQNAVVRYQLFDFIGGVRFSDEMATCLCAAANREVFVLGMARLKEDFDLKRTGLIAELLLDGAVVSRKTALFDREKHLSLPKATLKKEVVRKEDAIEITVTSDTFARLVRLESSVSTLPFSDNYFDLLPGESKTVTMALDKAVDAAEQAEKISLFCCTDVVPKSNTVREEQMIQKLVSGS